MKASVALPFNASGQLGPAAVTAGAVYLTGLCIREAAGTPGAAIVNIRNKGVVGGDIIWTSSLPASGSVHAILPDIRCEGQVYVEVATGTVVGDIYQA